MLKRIASDVTEPASPDAVRHHMDDMQRSILSYHRIEALREECRRTKDDLQRLFIGLLDGPPATFESASGDHSHNIGLDDPIYEQ